MTKHREKFTTPQQLYKARQKLVVDVIALKVRAGELGLHRTMHAFDLVSDAYGRDMDKEYRPT